MEQIEPIDFEKSYQNLKGIGFNPMPEPVRFSIYNARNILWAGIKFYLKEKAEWLVEYEEIAKWLSDNKGRGLLCYGNCGRGKSLICWKIIPLILHHYCKLIVSCFDVSQMNDSIERVKRNRLIYIDDIGTEQEKVDYGERRIAFSEIVDSAEKKGNLLIVTTNLTRDEISAKYGERTMDRLTAITKSVLFKGNSLRR